MCVSDSQPKKSVALNAVDAIHQGHGNVAKVDDKGQGLASSNVKGQVEGVDGTVQQLHKEGVDNHGCVPATTSHPSGEPLDSFGLGFSNLENDWELARSWECEELGTTTHQIVDVLR